MKAVEGSVKLFGAPLPSARGATALLICVVWACAALPGLSLRSFIWEEGTNAEIARAILAHGDFLQPSIYGVRWHEKPSLLAWLIAGSLVASIIAAFIAFVVTMFAETPTSSSGHGGGRGWSGGYGGGSYSGGSSSSGSSDSGGGGGSFGGGGASGSW